MQLKRSSILLSLFLVPVSCWAKAPVKPAAPKVAIVVDASEAARKIFHVKMTFEAAPGDLTLYYPKWIPGEHGPTGPIIGLAGLKFYAGGQELAWQRDPVDMYAIHLTAPSGGAIEAHLDYLSPAEAEGFSSAASATSQLAMISWNQVLLYPAGWPASDITFEPSLTLPEGWQFGTSLTITRQNGNTTSFAPVSLESLVDSPVLAGRFYKKFPLAAGEAPVNLNVVADAESSLAMTADELAHFKNLVAEANAFFGAHHYNHYDFLLTLSDHTAHFGLEHHQSSDDRIAERSLVDPDLRLISSDLLPHEFTHSWNGKYRRPAGLATPDYQKPMIGDLLWVYEGLTEYLGEIFAARSGLFTPELLREQLADTAARMDRARPGRTWRDLQDVARDAQDLYAVPGEAWVSWRRGGLPDFYDEGELIWLEVDTIIRQQTHGQKSLDDFGKLFHGGPSSAPQVKPYTFDDVVNALNQIAPYDWRKFFTTRLQSHGPGAPLGGIENSGWKLVYSKTKPEYLRAREDSIYYVDCLYSLGFMASTRDQTIIPDVIIGSPAYQAGIGPGMVLVAVNGQKFDYDHRHILGDALRDAKNSNQPISLLVRNGDYFKTFEINYHEGEKYPVLQRDSSKPDVLSEIIAPHAH